MQSPDKLSLIKLIVSSHKGSGGDDPVAHLLERVQDVERRCRELHASVLLVAVLRRRRRLLGQDAELVEWEAVNRATETETLRL